MTRMTAEERETYRECLSLAAGHLQSAVTTLEDFDGRFAKGVVRKLRLLVDRIDVEAAKL